MTHHGGVLREVLTRVLDQFLHQEYMEVGDTFLTLSDDYISEIQTVGGIFQHTPINRFRGYINLISH